MERSTQEEELELGGSADPRGQAAAMEPRQEVDTDEAFEQAADQFTDTQEGGAELEDEPYTVAEEFGSGPGPVGAEEQAMHVEGES